MQTFIVDSASDGKGLVRVILGQYPRLGTARLFQALRRKDIRVNGQRQHADCPVAAGDEIALYLTDDLLAGAGTDSTLSRNADTPYADIPYSVIYEDELILVVNKKPGITVQAATGGKSQGPVLIDVVRQDYQEPELELCHRLDRQTGGLLILARRQDAVDEVRELMKTGQVVKRYRCLVRGLPRAGQPVVCQDGCLMQEITGWLEKDAVNADVYIHDQKQPGDLPIVTRYRVLRLYAGVGPDQEDVSELEVELVTGRTHQIRAHLAHIGHPLLGDGKYGRNSFNRFFRGRQGPLTCQQLFSTSLSFRMSSKGPLGYLAGRTFTVKPDFDWPEPGKEPASILFE